MFFLQRSSLKIRSKSLTVFFRGEGERPPRPPPVAAPGYYLVTQGWITNLAVQVWPRCNSNFKLSNCKVQKCCWKENLVWLYYNLFHFVMKFGELGYNGCLSKQVLPHRFSRFLCKHFSPNNYPYLHRYWYGSISARIHITDRKKIDPLW